MSAQRRSAVKRDREAAAVPAPGVSAEPTQAPRNGSQAAVRPVAPAAPTAAARASPRPPMPPTPRSLKPGVAPERSGLSGAFAQRTDGLRNSYRDTVAELKKVNWPDRETTRNLTIVVIAVSIVLGLLLGGIDFVLQSLFEILP